MSTRRSKRKKVEQEVVVKEEPDIKVEIKEEFTSPKKGNEKVQSEPEETVVKTEPEETVVKTEPEETVVKTEPAETAVKSEPYASEEDEDEMTDADRVVLKMVDERMNLLLERFEKRQKEERKKLEAHFAKNLFP